MMKWMLAAGAAALAIAAPTAAERGGKSGGQQAQAQKADRGGNARSQRGGGDRKARAQRGGGERQARAQRAPSRERTNRASRRTERATQRSARVERNNDRRQRQSFASTQNARQERGRRAESERRGQQERAVRRDRVREQARVGNRDNQRARIARTDETRARGRGAGEARGIRFDRRLDNREAVRGQRLERIADARQDRVFRVRDVDRRGVVRFRDVDRDRLFARQLGFADGCPPGLAKKNNGCLPPGQARQFIGQPLSSAARLAALSPVPNSLRNLYWDDDDYYYRYGGNYLYRVDRNDDLIASMIPLFGAALLGQQLQPYYVNSYYRPAYYDSFYRNSPYDCYQYGYGYVYETDCASGLVEDVIPTYDYGYGIGQMLPASYGYYNVPFAYRSHFRDDDDYYYRYAPGAIYRVDRDTALISAVVALLGGGLSVGQTMPIGYNTYNVPLAYRSSYYDRPDVWYRYDNGYIYAVDPGTRLVRSVAYAV